MSYAERLAELRAKSNGAYARAAEAEKAAKIVEAERAEKLAKKYAGPRATFGDLPKFRAALERLASQMEET